MNLIPVPIKGSVLDLPIDPRIQLLYVTNKVGGGPTKIKPKVEQPPEKVKDLGEERHHQLLDAIKGLNVKQDVKQNVVTESLAQNRDWRR